MIIETHEDVTDSVLNELQRSDNARFKEIMSSAVRHLHAWVREIRLTEVEFQKACAIIAKLGQLSDKSHNEVVLIAGSLGVSSLVCLTNNGDHGQRETTANLLGPFWRAGSPRVENGGSIVRSETVGTPLFVDAFVKDLEGVPVANAEVDVWHTSGDGSTRIRTQSKSTGTSAESSQPTLRGRSLSAASSQLVIRFRSMGR